MKIGVGIGRKIVVDGEIDAFDIDASAKDVGGDADTLVELLELFVALDTDVMSVLPIHGRLSATYRSS